MKSGGLLLLLLEEDRLTDISWGRVTLSEGIVKLVVDDHVAAIDGVRI